MKKLRIAAILMIAVMAMFAFAGCGTGEADPDEDESAARTDFSALANFTASTLDGKKFTQDDLAKADLTIINVWSTTCEPCTEELPQLAAFGKSLPDNVKLITYCLDGLEDLSEDDMKFVSSFLEKADFDGVTLMRGDGDLETFTKEIQYTPTTIFVDSSGNQACEAIIGAEDDIKTVYTEHINKALEAMGKEPIS
ncbi:MAG: TlpA family protein disulfide reductase [Lachnospiraceae bacterium]|nr:TlpA family protein disulfide reductase [Lachnospiraceae bacterium]